MQSQKTKGALLKMPKKNASIKEFMLKDHERLNRLFLFDFIAEKNEDIGKAKSSFRLFSNGLRRHIRWEESILFPALEKRQRKHGGNLTKDLREDHREIRRILRGISKAIQEKDVKRIEHYLEQELCDFMSPHNNQEENVFYPALDGMLNIKERMKILDRME